MTRPPQTFGQLVKHWRGRRRLSQLALACEAGISPRHLGFLEVGRSRPSRDMVLTVSEALDIPLREQNTLLLAAGFAPHFPQTALGEERAWAPNKAIEFILERHEPNPVVVLDRNWNVLRANRAFGRLKAAALDLPKDAPLPDFEGQNLAAAVLDNEALLSILANAGEICHFFLKALRRDWAGAPGDKTLETLIERYEVACRERFPGAADRPARIEEPLLSVDFILGEEIVRLFSTITVLGTVQDALLEELRIETFFPADDASARILDRIAAERP